MTDTVWQSCHGPYETATTPDAGNPEVTDAPCYPKGDTHGALNAAPDTVTGCPVFVSGGDIDFDGSPYWPEWPTGPNPTSRLPGSFVQALPTSAGSQYSQYFVQTDVAGSESTCTDASTAGCAVPPPSGPGRFYPYFSRVKSSGTCTVEFGNVSSGRGVNSLGKDAQYGTDQRATLGYDEFIGPTRPNACTWRPEPSGHLGHVHLKLRHRLAPPAWRRTRLRSTRPLDYRPATASRTLAEQDTRTRQDRYPQVATKAGPAALPLWAISSSLDRPNRGLRHWCNGTNPGT